MANSSIERKKIEKRKLELRKKLLQIKKQKERYLLLERQYKESNKIEFFKPLEHQQLVLDKLADGKKVVLLQGANRIGKSVIGAVVTGAFGLGYYPWIEGKPATPFGKKPLKMRILCSDWEHHAGQVIVPKLKEWLPAGSYETKKNNVGIDAFWTFKETHSTIELMTHIQDTKIHEGWSGHFVWADEPPPRDKYIANRRGLIDFGGVMLLTLTAVSESWILDDIVLNEDNTIGCITEIPITANPNLDKEAIESFTKSLTEDEKIARIQGGWLNLVGRVLKDFNADIHVIEPFEIPTDYPVVAMIDLHLSTPQAIGFYAIDKHERIFVIDEVWENISPDEIADEIIRRKKQKAWRIENAFIDPLAKGDNLFMKNRSNVQDSFTIISNKLRPHGILLECASKDKDSGIRNLQTRLVGANKMPSLFFFNNCKRHLWEIQRWTYNEEGKPQKKDDHFMENLYRFTLTGIIYSSPEMWNKKMNFDVREVV